MRVPLEHKVLHENDRTAAAPRESFQRNGAFCLTPIISAGPGKTSLWERTLAGFDDARRLAVLTGDIETDNDARRLAVLTGDIETDDDARRLAWYAFPVRQITLARENARRVQPEIGILEVSRTSGAGLENWNDCIQRHL